ncbi:unnamed protein product [Euphydryas editha]|uniref:Uncharacterized protein n=1 Tax=Euphydryas editha TaxID=104508 RepID=A0AAU9UW12_EUPED|nr:unnamed protein product [Euphydryas editha]
MHYLAALFIDTIRRSQNSKVFSRDLSDGQSQLSKLKTVNVGIALTRAKILREIEKFYRWFYTSVNQPVRSSAEVPRAELTRYYSEDISDISMHALSEDGIMSEFLKASRHRYLVLQKLFNAILLEGATPETWKRSIVVLLKIVLALKIYRVENENMSSTDLKRRRD